MSQEFDLGLTVLKLKVPNVLQPTSSGERANQQSTRPWEPPHISAVLSDEDYSDSDVETFPVTVSES